MRLLATALTTLRSLINFLQFLDGVTLFVSPMAQAPRTPLLLLDNVPSGTYGKIEKDITRLSCMKHLILAARD